MSALVGLVPERVRALSTQLDALGVELWAIATDASVAIDDAMVSSNAPFVLRSLADELHGVAGVLAGRADVAESHVLELSARLDGLASIVRSEADLAARASGIGAVAAAAAPALQKVRIVRLALNVGVSEMLGVGTVRTYRIEYLSDGTARISRVSESRAGATFDGSASAFALDNIKLGGQGAGATVALLFATGESWTLPQSDVDRFVRDEAVDLSVESTPFGLAGKAQRALDSLGHAVSNWTGVPIPSLGPSIWTSAHGAPDETSIAGGVAAEGHGGTGGTVWTAEGTGTGKAVVAVSHTATTTSYAVDLSGTLQGRIAPRTGSGGFSIKKDEGVVVAVEHDDANDRFTRLVVTTTERAGTAQTVVVRAAALTEPALQGALAALRSAIGRANPADVARALDALVRAAAGALTVVSTSRTTRDVRHEFKFNLAAGSVDASYDEWLPT